MSSLVRRLQRRSKRKSLGSVTEGPGSKLGILFNHARDLKARLAREESRQSSTKEKRK